METVDVSRSVTQKIRSSTCPCFTYLQSRQSTYEKMTSEYIFTYVKDAGVQHFQNFTVMGTTNLVIMSHLSFFMVII